MFQCVTRADPTSWIDIQHRIDQTFRFGRDCVPFGWWILESNVTVESNQSYSRSNAHIIGASFDLIVQTMLIFIPERRIADQKDIEDNAWKVKSQKAISIERRTSTLTASPDIHRFGIGLFFQDFRTEITRCSSESYGTRPVLPSFILSSIDRSTYHTTAFVHRSLRWPSRSPLVLENKEKWVIELIRSRKKAREWEKGNARCVREQKKTDGSTPLS